MALNKLTPAQVALIEGKNFAHVATLNKDGSPQVSPVWIEHDGEYVVVNTEEKRLKTRNMKRDARVAVSIQDSANPYHYVHIKGRVVEVTREGGFEGIDRLSAKYTGQDKHPGNAPGGVRVQVKIEPIGVFQMG